MKCHVVPCGVCDSCDNFWQWYQWLNGHILVSGLLHCKAVLSSPEKQSERKDPQPDSFTAVGWADCPGSSRKKHQTTGQGVCHILT